MQWKEEKGSTSARQSEREHILHDEFYVLYVFGLIEMCLSCPKSQERLHIVLELLAVVAGDFDVPFEPLWEGVRQLQL